MKNLAAKGLPVFLGAVIAFALMGLSVPRPARVEVEPRVEREEYHYPKESFHSFGQDVVQEALAEQLGI